MSGGSRGLRVLLVAVVLGAIAASMVYLTGRSGDDLGGSGPARRPAPAETGVEGGAVLEGPLAGAGDETRSGLQSAPEGGEERRAAGAETGPFRGRIVDSSGAPVAAAQLFFSRDAGARATAENALAATDAEGMFALPLPAGVPREAAFEPPLFLAVTSESHVPTSFRVESFAFQSFVLQALPVVTGRVLDPGGLPVAAKGRVRLTVREASGESREDEADLDENGGFRLEGLPVGRLESAWALAKGYPEHEEPREEELVPDAIVSIDITLVPGALVTGRVIDAVTKEPVAGASVWADARDFDPEGLHPSAVTDAMGEFELEGVAPQRHVMEDGQVLAIVFLLARAEGYTEAPLQAYAAMWSEGGPYEFEVEIDRAAGFLSGVVFLPDGETPARGVLVHLIDALHNWKFARTNRNGEFEFEGLPLGAVELMARKGELSSEGGALLAYGSYVLEAGIAPACRLVLMGPGATAIRGRVVDGAGQPVPGTRMEARLHFHIGGLSMGIDSALATTDEAGEYAIVNISPGEYEVGPEGEGICSSPESKTATVGQDEVATGFDFTLQPCMRVAGRVEAGSHAVLDLELTLHDPETGRERAGTRPEEDGAFELDLVPTGVYELRLSWGKTVLAHLTVGPGDATGLVLGQ